MSGTSPVPSRTRSVRWLALAFVLALGVFTLLTVRDASQPAVRPAAGGTFTGCDVDGRLVQVCLFEQDAGWHGWLYREAREQTEWFTTTNRAHPWRAAVNVRAREETIELPDPIVASTDNLLGLNATLPRTNGWASDTANLTRQFEHLSFRQLTGLRIGRWGGTSEFHAQFPRLPGDSEFHAAVSREIVRACERTADSFTADPLEFWRENVRQREPFVFNTHMQTAHWQLRLLTTNLASFCVWTHDEVGGNGNHSRWRGMNVIAATSGVRSLKLGDLFHADPNTDAPDGAPEWRLKLRARCVPKLQALGAPQPEAVLEKDFPLDTFTLSPTGLQIYFNPYAIASGADGEFVVHFDYAELKDLLRSDGPAALLPRGP